MHHLTRKLVDVIETRQDENVDILVRLGLDETFDELVRDLGTARLDSSDAAMLIDTVRRFPYYESHLLNVIGHTKSAEAAAFLTSGRIGWKKIDALGHAEAAAVPFILELLGDPAGRGRIENEQGISNLERLAELLALHGGDSVGDFLCELGAAYPSRIVLRAMASCTTDRASTLRRLLLLVNHPTDSVAEVAVWLLDEFVGHDGRVDEALTEMLARNRERRITALRFVESRACQLPQVCDALVSLAATTTDPWEMHLIGKSLVAAGHDRAFDLVMNYDLPALDKIVLLSDLQDPRLVEVFLGCMDDRPLDTLRTVRGHRLRDLVVAALPGLGERYDRDATGGHDEKLAAGICMAWAGDDRVVPFLCESLYDDANYGTELWRALLSAALEAPMIAVGKEGEKVLSSMKRAAGPETIWIDGGEMSTLSYKTMLEATRTLCTSADPVASNILCLICARTGKGAHYDQQREIANRELRRRGSPRYDPDAYGGRRGTGGGGLVSLVAKAWRRLRR